MGVDDSLLGWVERNRNSVVELARDIIRFDTTVPEPGQREPRQDKDCQVYVASVLRKLGLSVDQWEPETDSLRELLSFIPGQNYKNRPLTVGVLKGKGGGKSLLMNAHIDTVPADPVDKWRHNPWGGEVEGDRLYGRGASDMKAGAAAMIKALQAIREIDVPLKGDVILEFVFDEELNGMGTAACVKRGYHAEIKQPHWTEGGAINAIEKTFLLLRALKELEADWQDRPDKRHKYLSTPKIVSSMIKGGQFACTYPEECDLVFDAQYLKTNADKTGWGSLVKKEVEEQIQRACESDSWLRGNRPTLSWVQAFPPSEVDEREPVVEVVRRCAQDAAGITPSFAGNDSNDDCSYLITMGGVPSVSFGPGPLETAHAIDEYVSIESMVKVTKILALCVARWCG